MAALTLPQARIAIGWATVGGERVAVQVDPEWMRYFVTLTERAGGVTGVSTTELVESAYDDAGIEEVKFSLYNLRDEFNAMPRAIEFIQDESQAPPYEPATIDDPLPQIQALSDQIAELTKEIQALKLGLVVI